LATAHTTLNVWPAPDHPDGADGPAVAYVRPHEIKVLDQSTGVGSLPALIRHVNSAGPLIHRELERTDDGSRFAVELTREESRGLQLQPGAQVHVELRNVRVFTEDYSI
jgi:sulfate/thiosulfate transport system ATP-binding protein